MEVKENMKLTIKRRVFNDVYYPHLRSSERFQVYWGGAGSGKSVFVAQKLILKLLSNPDHKLLVVRKTYATHLDSTFEELVNVLRQFQLLEHCRITKAPLSITLPNGAKIIFKGTDEETKLLSISGITLVWVEEAFEITEQIFEQLTLRLRGGKIKHEFYLTFNPIEEESWLNEYFFGEYKPDDLLTLHTTYKDNKFLGEDYVAELERKEFTNPDYYKVYALGQWGVMGEKVFTNWEAKKFEKREVERLPMILGLDFGFTSDPTTLVQGHVDEENKTIYISRGFYEKGLHNDEIAQRIKDMGLSKSLIKADSSEPKSISEIQRHGIRRIEGASKGNDSIRAGILRIKEYKIIVDPELDWFINELKKYTYKLNKTTGKYTSEPIGKFNHAMDAFRYGMQCIEEKPKKARFAGSVSKKFIGL